MSADDAEELKEALVQHILWTAAVETGFNYMRVNLETFSQL